MQPDHPNQQAKANLKAWWNSFVFTQKAKKDHETPKVEEYAVFGKPLKESLKYASVQISTANANGELYIWGYIPVVVAKCGLFLKETATEVEGTFRVNGSNKRMRELQSKFEAPPRYGKSLDWKTETYTTHDVASVFRRYLTQMPEPVIPYDMYHDFRDALSKEPYNQEEIIATYKRLIRSMPRANQYLLLYVLDLLSVFARKSDKNLMTAKNLAVIFRPGLISHPNHELSPKEHDLSQRVLEFLIAHQDWFMLDIPPPPQSEPGSPTSEPLNTDDIQVSPSSDEELSQIGGGWRLVGSDKRVKRRRTTLDRSAARPGALDEEPLKPPPAISKLGAIGVSRSRTLPSGSVRTGRSQESGARLLRKPKRASSTSQPKQSSTLEPLANV